MQRGYRKIYIHKKGIFFSKVIYNPGIEGIQCASIASTEARRSTAGCISTNSTPPVVVVMKCYVKKKKLYSYFECACYPIYTNCSRKIKIIVDFGSTLSPASNE